MDRRKNDFDFLKSLDVGLAKKRNKDAIRKNDFHHFIEAIYNTSKKYNFKPSDIIGWIKDLFDFCPSLQCELLSDNCNEPDLCLARDKENEDTNTYYLRMAQNREFDNDILENL